MGLAALIWGMMTPLPKLVVVEGHINGVCIAGFRLLGAAALYWIATLFLPKERVEPGDRIKIYLASICGVIFNQMTFTVGVGYTSPADAAIITTTTPILTMLLAAMILKEAVTGKKVAGVASSLIGAVLLIYGSSQVSHYPGDNNVLGDLLCLSAQFSVAAYFVCFKRLIAKYSPFTLMKWMFTYGALTCLPFTFHQLTAIPYAQLSAQTWFGLGYIVILGTFLCYVLMAFAQQRIRAISVSMYNYCQPVIASTLAVMWGMDSFGWLKTLSVILVFTGVGLVISSRTVADDARDKAE